MPGRATTDLLKEEMCKATSPLYNRNYAAAVKPGSTGSINVADPKAKAKTNPKRKAEAKATRENEEDRERERRRGSNACAAKKG